MQVSADVSCECGAGPFKSYVGLRIHMGHMHGLSAQRGRRSVRARQVFTEHNGPGPWSCAHCYLLVHEIARKKGAGLIHHKDEDFTNDAPSNLEVMHRKCHSRHHLADKPHTPEHNAKVGRKGRVFTSEWRAKISARGRERRKCPDCSYVSSPQSIGKHRKAGVCTPT